MAVMATRLYVDMHKGFFTAIYYTGLAQTGTHLNA